MYYIFVVDVDFVSGFLFRAEHNVFLDFNLPGFVNQFSFFLTILFFYSIPFMLLNIRQNFQMSNFKVENYVFSIIFLFLLIFYFDYNFPYGGGIFYKLSNLIFENNYLFYIFSLTSLNAFILIFYSSIKSKDTIFDLVLLLTLFLLEIDGVFYHETYDPLLYFIFFLLIKNKIYLNFTKMLTNKKFILLILFSISFYALSILKTIYNSIKMSTY